MSKNSNLIKNIKYLLFVLFFASVFVGCVKKDDVQTTSQPEMNTSKRLEEKLIPLPEMGEEMFTWMEFSENEQPIILTQVNKGNEEGKFKGYKWNDTEWEKIELSWSESLYNKKIYNIWPEKGQDGKYYLVNIEFDKSKDGTYGNYTLYRLNDENQFKEIKTNNEMFVGKPLEEDLEDIMSSFKVLDDNTLLVFRTSGKLIRYNLDTSEKLNEIQSSSPVLRNLFGSTFYEMNQAMDKILMTDVKTGEIIQEIDFEVIDNEDRQVRFCLDEEENLYIATRDGIFCKEKNADIPELLLSASESSVYVLADKEDVLIRGISKKDDSIYVGYQSEKGQTLYQYSIK